MNIIILTGNQPRHKFFANSICKEFEVDAIFSEGKVFNPAGESAENKILSPEDEKLWKWHFDLAKEEENNFFGQHHKFNCKTVLDVPKGEINTQLWFEKISQYKPQIVVVYGTSLLKENIINICKDSMINMHLGLSPYYRGSGTNFWPLHNNEPQFVGVTIHKIDPGIDTGSIIHQGRPTIQKGDNQHVIGNKAIIVGTELMKKTITEILDGTIKFFPQTAKGKLYSRKDFTVSNIAVLKKRMEEGMIEDYVDKNSKQPIEVKMVH